jgi:hypothetical protein
MKNMKSVRFMLSAVLLSLSPMSFAQTQTQPKTSTPAPVQSEAQKAFEKLKNLAGNWEGRVVTDPKGLIDDGDDSIHVTLRVTSRGNALLHEMKGVGPDDPITMFYLDQDRLLLTHFCDAGNRPRMVAKTSPDGKTVEFDFLDISGKMLTHHMQHAVFTFVDDNHHTEDWTFQMGDKPVHARIELRKASKQEASAR